MGRDVEAREFTSDDRTRFRRQLRRCLDAFAQLLDADSRTPVFAVDAPRVGVEIEFNLVDGQGEPAMRNAEALEVIADDGFQTELGLFNIEINVDPVGIAGDGLSQLAASLRVDLNRAEAKASQVDAHLMMIGILPTLRAEHLTREAFSPNPRYHLLSEQILAARGEDIEICIDGADHLMTTADSIIAEAACTSTQLHLQVEPAAFAPSWNAAQAIAGVQTALAANSPFLLGRQLWHETRIALFEQSTDTRSIELQHQGVRPRVWFGERWIASAFDLFEENAQYFGALLPIVEDEDPREVVAAGGVPQLAEMTLHNGTVYRWNRPIYDIANGEPHLRIENRLLPGGPTIIDTMANAALFYGLVRALAIAEDPVWAHMPFEMADQNFHVAARDGIGATQVWPGRGEVDVSTLVLEHLLPLAAAGLADLDVDGSVADDLLEVIERRCVTGRNGSTWLIAAYEQSSDLAAITMAYRDHMHSGDPVADWAPFSR